MVSGSGAGIPASWGVTHSCALNDDDDDNVIVIFAVVIFAIVNSSGARRLSMGILGVSEYGGGLISLTLTLSLFSIFLKTHL